MGYDDLFGDNLLKFLRNKNTFGGGDNFGGTPPFNPDPSQSVLPALRGTNSDKRYGTGENLFGQTSRTGSVVDETSDKFDPVSRMRDLYQPDTDMSERYKQALDEMPERNEPGLLRKIFGGMAALDSPESAERVLYAPYHRQMEDWKAKISPLAQASNIERQNNSNLRMVANQILSGELGDKRLQRMTNRDKVLQEQGDARIEQGNQRILQGDERVRQGDERMKQSEERIKIAREVARGGQFQVDNAGNAFIVKKDGSTIPVNASYLSFEEKEGLKAESAGAAAKARETNKRDRIVDRVIEDPDNPGKFIRTRVNLDTGEVEPLKVKSKTSDEAPVAPPKSEGEQGKGIVNKAQRIKNSNSRWSKWIKIDKGRVDITRPGIFTGPSEEEYNQIYEAIFGGSAANTPTTGKPATTNKPVKPGKMRIVGPEGQKGTVPEGTDLSKWPGWKKE